MRYLSSCCAPSWGFGGCHCLGGRPVRIAERDCEAKGRQSRAKQRRCPHCQPRRRRHAATNGSKTEASSGSGASRGGHQLRRTPLPPAEQRRQINSLLVQFGQAADAAAKSARTPRKWLVAYEHVQRFDSAGYFYEQVAALQPGPQATQQAADAYFQAYSFASHGPNGSKLLGGKARALVHAKCWLSSQTIWMPKPTSAWPTCRPITRCRA